MLAILTNSTFGLVLFPKFSFFSLGLSPFDFNLDWGVGFLDDLFVLGWFYWISGWFYWHWGMTTLNALISSCALSSFMLAVLFPIFCLHCLDSNGCAFASCILSLNWSLYLNFRLCLLIVTLFLLFFLDLRRWLDCLQPFLLFSHKVRLVSLIVSFSCQSLWLLVYLWWYRLALLILLFCFLYLWNFRNLMRQLAFFTLQRFYALAFTFWTILYQ